MPEKYCDVSIPPRGIPTRDEYEKAISGINSRLDSMATKNDLEGAKTDLENAIGKIRIETHVVMITGDRFTITLEHPVRGQAILATNGDINASSHHVVGTHLSEDRVTLTVKIDETVTDHAYRVNVAYISTD